MAQLFDIKKVTIGPWALAALVELAPSAPLMTSEDPEGTARVLELMPGLAGHACLGDASASFGEVVQDTELAHLLEHVTVELLAQTNVAGDISSGQTIACGERTYEITLSCPDDVLVTGALSSAAWVLQWAYSGGGEPQPDIAAIAQGLVGLVQSLAAQETAEQGEQVEEPAPESEAPAAPGELEPADAAAAPALEPAFAPATDPEPPVPAADAPAPEGEEPPATPSAWDMDNVPRPHLVR